MKIIATPQKLVDEILTAAGTDLILIGGQALAFWMAHYHVPSPDRFRSISKDTDFLARSSNDLDRARIHQIAQKIGSSQVVIPSHTALTSLVGQIFKDLPESAEDEGGRINIDFVFQVIGTDTETVAKRSIKIQFNGSEFSIMHPIDVLKSRIDNLHQLQEKKENPINAENQILCAIRVMSKCLIETHDLEVPIKGKRSVLLGLTNLITKIALSDAGRKISERHDLFAADAIEPFLIENKEFHEKRLPQILELMSPTRRNMILQEIENRQKHSLKIQSKPNF